MSQTSSLLKYGGGAAAGVFMPIMIIIALVFASLSSVEQASACSSIASGEPAKFVYPVASHDPRPVLNPGFRRAVAFFAGSKEEVKAVSQGEVTKISGNQLTLQIADTQTPRPTDGSGQLRVVLSGFTEFLVQEHVHVTAGQTVGKASGLIEIEVWLDGKDVDPMDFLKDQTPPESGACGCGSGTATGSNNEQKAFNYFVSVGYKKEWAAGIVGNMINESNVEPKKLNTPTGGVIASSKDVNLDGRAWGVVQWYPPRKMIEPSRQHGSTWEQIDSLEYQLEFLWKSLEGTAIGANRPDAGQKLKATSTVEEAAFAFGRYFEVFTLNDNDPEFNERRRDARKVYDQYAGGAPAAGSGDGASNCTGKVIKIDGRDYAFPMVGAKNDISNGYSWPCASTCHHDGTPAFDLARKALDDSSAGVPTVAITGGHIENFDNHYAGIEGCQSFQLVGDDGWWYWYGHQANTSVHNGQTVTAGQPISEIGKRACTGNGSYPHLHIDRGSPKGSNGGSKCCRDRGMVDLINQLYAGLPDAS